ncbi:radical SAM family heme chaperone HemW [Pseudemcibacter aquimaris]|uniref:radical SAM family heme chaperone HemW n=1 Tax=Pseudemcibacter aquimaris TaxID=2857064 RepID=UPI00201277F3|nr:radical SAM family heme chaperone HemW [Pseudemcibacter aquimaris]MCC3860334.1 radical SAM family heme chaperone HemW [Pseudemcibacter aquimaris]
MPASNHNEISIYVHWPFCLAKCPYCDFNSHVRETINEDDMRDALLSEVEHYANLVGKRTVKSIFFGGGTPSLMSANTVETVIRHIDRTFGLSDDIEITLEANPTSVEAAKFADFASVGVNRVSIGIQALNDSDLKALGREHSVNEALGAIELSQKYFSRSNFDLIYARMGQTTAEWEQELSQAIKMANGHLSLYQLTIEQGTPFYGSWRKGDLVIPEENVSAEMYDLTNQICSDQGYPAYEVSNYARKGEESRHNLTYWRYGDYIGVGAGAHGRISYDGNTYATMQNKKPETWLKNTQMNGHATKDHIQLSATEMAEEMIMMGLRLTDGIDLNTFENRIGKKISDFTGSDQVDLMITQGFLAPVFPDRLQLTEKGRPLLNQILGQILV